MLDIRVFILHIMFIVHGCIRQICTSSVNTIASHYVCACVCVCDVGMGEGGADISAVGLPPPLPPPFLVLLNSSRALIHAASRPLPRRSFDN